MSELDPVHEALERLEWEDGEQEETPRRASRAVTRRTALTGGAAGLVAARAGGVRLQRQRASTATGHGGSSGSPASGIFKATRS